eukprot:TRINITY_DN29037_c0_g1_i1.p1 TRINITY_DN29037_c0_g1~~TRINITY_DN29037_c0_g1_i1.p1  ORF type:complete len:246 (+),score=49.86 TRINITY_DN29037_c0_g1_i1:55-792(+)
MAKEAIVQSSPQQGLPIQLRLPLSDKDLDLKAINKILASAQTREKALKVFQYTARLLSYFLLRGGASVKDWGKHFEALAKNLSTARRFFKLMRFMKHFEDIAEAREEKSPGFRSLLYLDVACNVVADVSEDFTSLEKIGFVRKGTLPKRTEYYSNWCQLALAVVEIFVHKVKADRAREKAASPGATLEVQRKNTVAKLELSKFFADLIKAFWDCELSFASELAFCLSGLWASLVSTHKYMLRAIK